MLIRLHRSNGRSPRSNNTTNGKKSSPHSHSNKNGHGHGQYRTYNVKSPRTSTSTSPQRSTVHASGNLGNTASPRPKNNHNSLNAPIIYPSTDLIVDLIICGYMRIYLLQQLQPRNTKSFIIPTQITLITSRYFYKTESQGNMYGHKHVYDNNRQPLYLCNPNVPAPPSRNPPSPPYGTTEQKEQSPKLRGRLIEGKYQQVFDIYRDRLESIESRIRGLNGSFYGIQAAMENTLSHLENRRINDIKTIQSQFNNTITALCYQINAQINNQIKLLTTKLDNNRKYSGDKIEELQNKLCRLQKENDSLRKQRKIDKILKLNGSANGSAPSSPTKSAVSAPDVQLDIDEIQKVKDWLCDLVKLPQYFDLFIENGYDDLETLSDLTMEELEHIGIEKRGHRKKILKHAMILRDDVTPLSQRELNLNWTGQQTQAQPRMNGQNGHHNGHHNGHNGHTVTMSPNSANGGPSNSTVSGHSAHSSLYSHNIWSEHDSNDNINMGSMNDGTHNIWGAYSLNGHHYNNNYNMNNNGALNQNQ